MYVLSNGILAQRCPHCENNSVLQLDEANWCCRICGDRSRGFARFLESMTNPPPEYPKEVLSAMFRLPSDDPYAIQKELGRIAAADAQREALAAMKDQQALLAVNSATLDVKAVSTPDQGSDLVAQTAREKLADPHKHRWMGPNEVAWAFNISPATFYRSRNKYKRLRANQKGSYLTDSVIAQMNDLPKKPARKRGKKMVNFSSQ